MRRQTAVSVLISLCLWLCVSARAQNAASQLELNIKPKECAVLEQGDTCFVTVHLHWQAAQPGSYCLFEKATQLLLECWENATKGTYSTKLETVTSVEYFITAKDNSHILVKTQLNVSWVYKKTSRPIQTWRIF